MSDEVSDVQYIADALTPIDQLVKQSDFHRVAGHGVNEAHGKHGHGTEA